MQCWSLAGAYKHALHCYLAKPYPSSSPSAFLIDCREDGVWIEEAAVLPGTFFIAEGFAGHPLERYQNPDKIFDMHEFVKMGLWDKPRSQEELLALEAGGSSMAVLAPPAAEAGEEGGAMDTAEEAQLEERLEELELMEELDDMPDVPAVDMM